MNDRIITYGSCTSARLIAFYARMIEILQSYEPLILILLVGIIV